MESRCLKLFLVPLLLTCATLHTQGCKLHMDVLDCVKFYRSSTFVEFINKTQLLSMFTGDEPKSIFVPPDQSFRTIPPHVLNNLTLMKDVIKYHLVKGYVDTQSWKNEDLITTASTGLSIRVNQYKNATTNLTTASGAWVIIGGLNATNGEVILMDRVMYPLPSVKLYSLLATTGEFSTLLLLVSKAGIQATLQATGPYTLFAPNNEAFDRLPPGTLSSWLADIPTLKRIIEGHLVEGTLYTASLDLIKEVKAVSNISWNTGKFHIGSAKVGGIIDVSAVNGVFQEIDHVLIPNN